jgi:hypothetical protein
MVINAFIKPLYTPGMRIVTGITNALPAVVTTSFAHGYKDLLIVRIDMPPQFGMQQINQLTGTIFVLSPTTFSISIDTRQMDPFSVPANWPYSEQLAQCVPVGEDNSTLTSATVNASNPS